jgi:hypothetical protein
MHDMKICQESTGWYVSCHSCAMAWRFQQAADAVIFFRTHEAKPVRNYYDVLSMT